MTKEETRLRALYLFLVCAEAIDEFKDRLTKAFPELALPGKRILEESLRRELAILFRYWATRQVWRRLEEHEEDAKNLNIFLLRFFVEGFKFPKDGSGLRYAELSSPSEEVQELSRRITNALDMEHQPLLALLYSGIGAWREKVVRHANVAIDLSLDQVSVAVKKHAREPKRGI